MTRHGAIPAQSLSARRCSPKNGHAMTLVEVVIALALLASLAVASASILGETRRLLRGGGSGTTVSNVAGGQSSLVKPTIRHELHRLADELLQDPATFGIAVDVRDVPLDTDIRLDIPSPQHGRADPEAPPVGGVMLRLVAAGADARHVWLVLHTAPDTGGSVTSISRLLRQHPSIPAPASDGKGAPR